MTEARYTPQMVVATVCVLLLPAGVVWTLHSTGVVSSFWLSLIVGLTLTFTILTLGTAYWRRRRHPPTVLFSELLVWGWIRHQYLDHKIDSALHSIAQLHEGDPARRAQLLTEIADAVEAKDPFLYGHSRRIARYVMRVARRMHLDRSEVARLRTAALLHDVGKLHTPPDVLLQPRKLTAEETAVMRRHAEDGAEMVAALGDRDLAGIVRHHHERFDGAGYPGGLEGELIPLGSRIIAVPDTFDAMTTRRPYRPGLSHKRALTVLRDEAGKQFDPAVVRAFLAEYTDRRGAMIWAVAEQLVPALRVGAVAVAAVVLNTAVFAASAPSASVQPKESLSSERPPTGSGSTQPGASAPTPPRPVSSGRHEAVVRKRGTTQQPARASATTTSTPPSGQPILQSVGSSPVPPTSAPTAPPALPARSQPVALTPKTLRRYSRLGRSLTDRAALNVSATPEATPPAPTGPTPGAPTTTTTPTTPTAPPAPTTPVQPGGQTTPTPPSNPDQCKNGGWQTLGYKNQGQCIAATKPG